MSIIVHHSDSVKDKLFHNMMYNLFFTLHEKSTIGWKDTKIFSLKQRMSTVERPFCAIPPHRQVRGHTRSQEEGAADVALKGSSQHLLLSLRTKPEPELESFLYTQDQLGSINGFGVDQPMAIVFHCCDSVCTDNPTHTHTHLHVHHCAAMQMFTPMSWFVSFHE